MNSLGNLEAAGRPNQRRDTPDRRTICTLAWLAITVGLAAAADKSGVSPNSISLPKGPGSIEGLGDSFQPTLNTGTAKYGLGLKVLPGPAGHQPSLALSYDGGGGNGPLTQQLYDTIVGIQYGTVADTRGWTREV